MDGRAPDSRDRRASFSQVSAGVGSGMAATKLLWSTLFVAALGKDLGGEPKKDGPLVPTSLGLV